MTGIICAALTLLGLLPVSLDICRAGGVTEAAVSAASLRLRLPKRRRRPPRGRLMRKVKNAYTTLCRIVPHLWVDELTLSFTAAWPDPAVTAAAYGAAGVALEALRSVCDGRVGTLSLRAEADLEADAPTLYLRLRLCGRLYRLAFEALLFGLRALYGSIRDRLGKGDRR